MPPRPRKRKPSETASDSEGSESVTAPTPAKKSRSSTTAKELKAELRERARLAILNSKSGRSSSASVLRGGGASAKAAATTSPSSTKARKLARKSSGTAAASASASASSADESETGEEKKVGAQRRGRKSAPVAFRPLEPTAEEGGGEEEKGDEERRFGPHGTPVRQYGPNGTPVARTKTNEASPELAARPKSSEGEKEGYRYDGEDVSDAKHHEAPAASSLEKKAFEKASAKKKLKEEAHARALAYKRQLEQKMSKSGETTFRADGASAAKSPAFTHSSNRKVAASTPAGASGPASGRTMARSPEEMDEDKEDEESEQEVEEDRKPASKLPRLSSPDPPEHRAAPAPVSVAAAAASMTTRTTTNYRSPLAAAKSTSASTTKSTRAKPAKKNTNPAVAAIFAAKTPSAAHRPNRQIDPNRPFPSAGYRLPTAAYCGCGPTPFSSRSANATTAMMTTAATSDLCRLDSTGATQSQYSANIRRVMREIPPVDPPHRSFSRENLNGYGGGSGVGDRGKGDNREAHGDHDDDDEDDVTMKENDTSSNNSSKPSPPGKSGYEFPHQGIRKTPVPLEVHSTTAPTPARTAVDPPVPAPTRMQRAPVTEPAVLATPNASMDPSAKPMTHAVRNPAARDPEVLQSATKAFAMIAKAKRENEQRRRSMGIGVRRTPSTNGDGSGEGETAQGNRDGIRFSDPPIAGEGVVSTTGAAAATAIREDIYSEKVAEKVEKKNTNQAATAEEEVVNVATQKKTRSFGARLVQFGLVVVVALLAIGGGYLSFFSGDSSTMNSVSSLLHTQSSPSPDEELPAESQPDKKSSCFIDHPSDFFSPGEDLHRDEAICGGEYIKCPRRGRCHGGRLRDCNSDGGGDKFGFALFLPNDEGVACVPSAEALDLVRKVEEVLLDLTAADACRWWSLDNYKYPTFGLWAVADGVSKQMNGDDESISPENLQWLLPVLDSSRVIMQSAPATNIRIIGVMGLGSAVPLAELPIPFTCMLRIGTWELIVSLLSCSFTFAWNTAKSTLFFAIHYPFVSFALLSVASIANLFRKRRQRRDKIKDYLNITLNEVYDRLAEYEDNDSYPNIHLRDDIGRDMFHLNTRERFFFYDHVWPLVVRDVNSDNRVKKALKEVDGKKMLHWQMDGQTKRSRKGRRSRGGFASGVESVQSKSPTQRES